MIARRLVHLVGYLSRLWEKATQVRFVSKPCFKSSNTCNEGWFVFAVHTDAFPDNAYVRREVAEWRTPRKQAFCIITRDTSRDVTARVLLAVAYVVIPSFCSSKILMPSADWPEEK